MMRMLNFNGPVTGDQSMSPWIVKTGVASWSPCWSGARFSRIRRTICWRLLCRRDARETVERQDQTATHTCKMQVAGGKISECRASKILGRVSQVLSWVGVNNSYAGFGRRGRCCIFVILSCHFLSYLLVRCLEGAAAARAVPLTAWLERTSLCHGDMLLFWFV